MQTSILTTTIDSAAEMRSANKLISATEESSAQDFKLVLSKQLITQQGNLLRSATKTEQKKIQDNYQQNTSSGIATTDQARLQTESNSFSAFVAESSMSLATEKQLQEESPGTLDLATQQLPDQNIQFLNLVADSHQLSFHLSEKKAYSDTTENQSELNQVMGLNTNLNAGNYQNLSPAANLALSRNTSPDPSSDVNSDLSSSLNSSADTPANFSTSLTSNLNSHTSMTTELSDSNVLISSAINNSNPKTDTAVSSTFDSAFAAETSSSQVSTSSDRQATSVSDQFPSARIVAANPASSNTDSGIPAVNISAVSLAANTIGKATTISAASAESAMPAIPTTVSTPAKPDQGKLSATQPAQTPDLISEPLLQGKLQSRLDASSSGASSNPNDLNTLRTQQSQQEAQTLAQHLGISMPVLPQGTTTDSLKTAAIQSANETQPASGLSDKVILSNSDQASLASGALMQSFRNAQLSPRENPAATGLVTKSVENSSVSTLQTAFNEINGMNGLNSQSSAATGKNTVQNPASSNVVDGFNNLFSVAQQNNLAQLSLDPVNPSNAKSVVAPTDDRLKQGTEDFSLPQSGNTLASNRGIQIAPPAEGPTIPPPFSNLENLPQNIVSETSSDSAISANSGQNLTQLYIQQSAAAQTDATSISHKSSHISPHISSPNWDSAVAQKINWMISDGLQSAQLTLNPPDLGPLQVTISIKNDQADARFFSEHQEVRDALESAMPKLQQMMSDSGIQLSGFSVSSELNNNANSNAQQFQQPAKPRYSDSAGKAEDTLSVTPSISSKRRISDGNVDTFA